MFKPGEVATLRLGSDGRTVTVLGSSPTGSDHKWPVATSDGVFDETELAPAHPTVLATAAGRDPSADAFRDVMDRMAAEDDGKGLSFELRDKVEKVLAKASLDFNGHWKDGAILREDFKALKHMFLGRNAMSQQDAEDLVRAADKRKPLDRWVPVDASLGLSGLRTCSYCGEEDFATETNGRVVRLAGAPCKFPKGLPLTEWELNVPSGKLVVANDLRELFPLPEDEDFDINTSRGCSQTALAYAANGMSHAFVGNSCPGVYKCGDGVFKIANPPRDETWDEKKKNYVKVKNPPKFEGEEVAGITTDLWWFSLCDQAEFQRRCKRFKQKASDFTVETVDVKPGVYRFHHDEEARSHDGPSECVYTRFEWVREADPVQDLLAQYEEVEVNANAYVQAQVARWPTLFGKTKGLLRGRDKVTPWSDMTEEERRHSWQRVADQAFCTIGGGVEWHEKGFPKAKVDASVPDVDPPSFRAQQHWYPFSKPYGGLFEPKTLAPSFAKLAFRVLESVISFGTDVRDGEHSREVRYVRERMMVAVKRYRELAKRLPEQADPEYVAWLSQKGRAEAWVESFPLGPEFTDKHRNHASQQRWVPVDAYAVVFDARKLKEGHFAWHPKKGGCWAKKEDAQRYAILEHGSNGQPPEHNCFWSSHATNTSVPLYCVARVVNVGEVSHMGETLVEVAFDYGTTWMTDGAKRKALAEQKEKAAIQVLSREEYDLLLPIAIAFFTETEAQANTAKAG
jgi:hypothetical protein